MSLMSHSTSGENTRSENQLASLACRLQQGELNASGLGLVCSDLHPALRLRFDNVQVAAFLRDPDLT